MVKREIEREEGRKRKTRGERVERGRKNREGDVEDDRRSSRILDNFPPATIGGGGINFEYFIN